ncbi:uncharacterized protein LOC133336226 [Musca vetustissima]|uniref:uncharacterized protein LOC133336226 n=1 Tax=Musca vetustissima TaxID=27455 RepID=UPI002AB7E6B6|nr:uncharacterized protein LOC133336226 [Musca vetustissima]
MEEYVNAMILTSIKVNNAGLVINDEVTASLMLAGLPEEFQSLMMAIENSKTKLTVDSVQNLLLQDAKYDNNKKEKTLVKNCPKKNKNNPKKPTKNNDEVLYAALISETDKVNEWYIDSGATSHITNNRDLLFNETKVCNKEIVVANNNKLKVSSSGDIQMSLNMGENVEYVPDICANLLLVAQLTQNGKKVIFEKDICQIFNKDDNLIGEAVMNNGLYHLKCDVNTTK